MGASVKMHWSPSVALAQRAILAIVARYKQLKILLKCLAKSLSSKNVCFRYILSENFPCLPRHQLIGADDHLHAKMEDAVAKRTLPSSVTVLMVGLDVTVTSPESPVKQLRASEVFFICCTFAFSI